MSAPSYRLLNFQVNLVRVPINLLGGVLTFLYFTVINPTPTTATPLTEPLVSEWVFFVVGTSIIFVTAYLISRSFGIDNKLLRTWYVRMGSPDAPPEAPLAVRRAALNFVPANTVVNLFAWLMAWVFFGLLSPLVNGEPLDSVVNDFLGIVGVGGIFTTAIIHFLLELVWRPALTRYFPDGRLSATPAFRLPVLGRLLVFFLLVGILPAGLLVLVSLTRSHAILDAPNPHLIYDNLLVIEIFIVSVTVLSSIGIAIFVSRTIVEPLRALQTTMSRVAVNDLSVRAAVTTNDELGYLSERFNDMVGGLQRAELMRNLLNLYISPQVARDALEHGAHLGGSLVECSVLFSDLRDFTGLSERLPPSELIALLNRYLSAMIAIIIEHGGFVNKFGGDSLLAVFGTPLNPAADHAARAVLAAQAMRRTLQTFNTGQVEEGSPALRIGIGIASGPVVAGNVGGEGRIEYTVIGDTVNVAARLQGMTRQLECDVLLDEDAYRSARSSLEFEARRFPQVEVRGKKQLMDVYALV